MSSTFGLQSLANELPTPGSSPHSVHDDLLAHLNQEPWLHSLDSHPVWTLPDNYQGPSVHSKVQTFLVVRGTELIVAVGNELRIVHLGDIKSRSANDKGYKVLDTQNIDFTVTRLVASSNGKLLAVLGHRRAAVLVLPRRGWTGLVGSKINVKSLQVGQFYHGLSSSPSISEAKWHPYGSNDSTLLILTVDGKLREYDVGDDADDPVQTIDFCSVRNPARSENTGYGLPRNNSSSIRKELSERSPRSPALSTWSADDPGADVAVSFCIGQSQTDWGLLTLYCLFQNGDIYTICPYIPKSGAFPRTYFASLVQYVTAKLNTAHACLEDDREMEDSSLSAQDAVNKYRAQLHFVNYITRRAKASSENEWKRDREGLPALERHDGDKINIDGSVDRGRVVIRQGPFLLQPAPKELDREEDCFATDLACIAYSSSAMSSSTKDEIDETDQTSLMVFVVAHSNGKVDVALELDSIEPCWLYDKHEEELPSLMVYESIDLGISSDRLQKSTTSSSNDTVQVIVDGSYPDTVYVSHKYGVHCITFSAWLEPVYRSLSQETTEATQTLDAVISQKRMSNVSRILKDDSESLNERGCIPSLAIINNPFLDYVLLILPSSFKLVSLELSLRVPSDPKGDDINIKGNQDNGFNQETPRGYIPLLKPTAFNPPPPLSHQADQPQISRIALPSKFVGKGPLTNESITADHLRFMGEAVESYREQVKNIATAANVVQDQMELQMREFSRQLDKLEELTKGKQEERRNSEKIAERLEAASARQKELLSRLDKTLQKLMDNHQPELSRYEKQWFDELRRIKDMTLGNDRGTKSSLSERLTRVEEQFEIVKQDTGVTTPSSLKMDDSTVTQNNLASNLGHRSAVTKNSSTEMGRQQLEKVEDLLGEESRLLNGARQKADRLYKTIAAQSKSS